jgi:hypothetical protein
VIEKSSRANREPATGLALRPGDFVLGSRKSRAVARALLEQRKRPKHPPHFTLDVSSQNFERCQEIYARIVGVPTRDTVPASGPYFETRFADGFTLTDPTSTDGLGTGPSENEDFFGDR